MNVSKFDYLVAILCVYFLVSSSKIGAKPNHNNLVLNQYGATSLIDSLCNGALSSNLLSIGDFGAGAANVLLNDPEITLGYDYQNAPPPDDGTYTITNDISDWDSFADLFWINIGDNSADPNGYMMVVNAHYEPGNFYKEIVEVCENTTYVFSADMINLTKSSISNFILPSVDFIVNGVIVTSVVDLAQDEQWHTSEFSYTTGPGETTLVYAIRNNAPGGFGNDLAIDNIFMKTCVGQIDITQHETLCENAYLQATITSTMDDFIPHYQWEYSLDGGASWIINNNVNTDILSLINLPPEAIYRCLLAAGPNNFDVESCHTVSNEIDIDFPHITAITNPTICENEVYAINGNEYTTTGIYLDTFTTFFGCDSIVTTNLQVLNSSNSQETVFICEDETYNFQGAILNITDQYIDTLINVAGCDSILTLDLIVLSNSYHNFEETICEPDTYFFNNEFLSTAGFYTDTLTSYNGCDSFLNLQLTVNPSFESFDEASICDGDYYTFDGIDQTVAGGYSVTLSTINGCDSILNLSLEVIDNKQNEISEQVCVGQSYIHNNNTYTATGIYLDTLVSFEGCDSVLTLDLVFIDVIEVALEESICNGESYFFNNANLITQGVYTDTLTSMMGCDSIVTLSLEVVDKKENEISELICNGQGYINNNVTYNTTGIYLDTLTTTAGCDSILTLNLVFVDPIEESLEIIICENESYFFNNVELTNPGIYQDTLMSTQGCDSIIILDLVVLENSSHDLEASICENDTYFFNDESISVAGLYTDTLASTNGCDSFVTLKLNVNLNFESFQEATICAGESYSFNEVDQTVAGEYVAALITENGCDSIVTLSLEVVDKKENEITTVLCSGQNYIHNNITYTTTGIYFDTLTAFSGCDSILTLNLVFEDAIEASMDASICDGESYLFNNEDLTAAGIYRDTLLSMMGCDSIVTLSLEVVDKKENEIVEFICSGQNYIHNNVTYTMTGIYTDSLISVAGCDSILTLDLVFGDVLEEAIEVHICEDESYFFKEMNLTESGVYKDSLQNAGGCDSIVTLTLLKFENSEVYLQQDICEDDDFQFGGVVLSSSGMYFDTLVNQNGCDSILYLDLMVHAKYETELPVDICFGEVFTYDGVNYNASGTYPIVYNSINNCDSTILLLLTIGDEITSNFQQEICDGEIFEMGGSSYTMTGEYEIILPLSSGCDSTLVLNLLVHENATTYLEETICFGESYQIGNTNFNETGAHTATLTTQNGCDSIVNLSLSVYQSETYESLTFCYGENYNGIHSDTMITLYESSYLGCDSVVQLQLNFHEMQFLEIIGEPIFCEGEKSILHVNSFDAYLWSNGATTSEVEISEPGIYEVTVWDGNGCTATESIEVAIRSLDAEIMTIDPNCNNANAGLIEVEDVFGGSGYYQYSLDGVEFSNNNIFYNLSAGSYDVTIRDELGCEYVHGLLLDDPVEYELSVDADEIIEYGDSTMLFVDTNSDITLDTFYWFPQAGLSCLDCLTPMASPTYSTVYTLTLVTAEGCTIKDQFRINVSKPKDVYVPNVFTPNADGQNDVFKVYPGRMVDRILQFDIYDRWGEHVYSEIPNGLELNGWDGNFNVRELQQDVYIYMVRIAYIDGEETIITGDVTLVR